ncbi:MAG: small multi-drug export protein [Fibrobacteres bacterium]|nr:small multi-drug export protein [Fibrobacterota bacterium]
MKRLLTIYKKLRALPEGRVLLAFFVLLILSFSIIALGFVQSARTGEALTGVLLFNTFGGRAAAIALCVKENLSFWQTVSYNMLLETLNLFFMYALFVLSYNQAIQIEKFRFLRVLKRANENIGKGAEKYRSRIEKFGWIGLFVFVMIPLPVTGPVVGSISGYLMRMSIRKNFSAVIGGCFVSVVIWTKFLHHIQKYEHGIQIIFGIILIGALIFCSKFIGDFYHKMIRPALKEP